MQSVTVCARRADFQIQKGWQKNGGQKNSCLRRHSVILLPPIFLPIPFRSGRRPNQAFRGSPFSSSNRRRLTTKHANHKKTNSTPLIFPRFRQ
jgi:hypothetical protein